MGNDYKGDVGLELGGKRVYLRYDWEAIALLKSELGSDFENKISSAMADFDSPSIAQVLSIGLRHHYQDKWTEDKIMHLSPPFISTCNAINRAITLAFFGTTEVSQNPPIAERIKARIKTLFWRPGAPHSATA